MDFAELEHRRLRAVGDASFAAGLACTAAVAGGRRPAAVHAIAALALLVVFLLLMAAASRAGGLVPLPTGTSRQRWLRQVPELAALGLGLVAGPTAGWATALLTWAIAGGIALWWKMTREQHRPA